MGSEVLAFGLSGGSMIFTSRVRVRQVSKYPILVDS